MISDLLDFIFPKTCFGCQKEGNYLCSSCLEKLEIKNQFCPNCEKASIDGMTHAKCLTKLGLDGTISLWHYGGGLRKAILEMKYRFSHSIAKHLAIEFVNKIKNKNVLLPKKAILLPIPLYWYKKNFRGFNQTEIMGEIIAEKFGWEYQKDLLIRTKSTLAQSLLSEKERRKNIRGAFSLSPIHDILPESNSGVSPQGRMTYQRSIHPRLNRGFLECCYNSFVLFDDVFTSGATIKEAAKVLKRNGAKIVWGLTLAR